MIPPTSLCSATQGARGPRVASRSPVRRRARTPDGLDLSRAIRSIVVGATRKNPRRIAARCAVRLARTGRCPMSPLRIPAVLVTALVIALAGCSAPAMPTTPTAPSAGSDGRAPESFRVRLDTTKGPIVLEVQRAWAPHGVDRFYRLVREGYFDDAAI